MTKAGDLKIELHLSVLQPWTRCKMQVCKFWAISIEDLHSPSALPNRRLIEQLAMQLATWIDFKREEEEEN